MLIGGGGGGGGDGELKQRYGDWRERGDGEGEGERVRLFYRDFGKEFAGYMMVDLVTAVPADL